MASFARPTMLLAATLRRHARSSRVPLGLALTRHKHSFRRLSTAPSDVAAASGVSEPLPAPAYTGPLAPTFRRLKVFSLSTFALSTLISPFMFAIDSSLPTSARIALATTALGTSAISTAMVNWVGKPYVVELKPILADGETFDPGKIVTSVEMLTYTLALRKRVTKVYDTSFLVPAERPFASWRLATKMLLTNAELENKIPEHGSEETVAETFGEKGDVLGRWIVKWEVFPEMESVVGECREVGKIVKNFNVHEELLEYAIR